MLWIYGCLIFIIGVIVGIIATRLGTKGGKKHKELQKELEKSQYELEQYRQELVDHFAQSANLMENISKDYEKLYSHMAKTSTELMPSLPAQDNPFSSTAASLEAKSKTTEENEETPQELVETVEDKTAETLQENNDEKSKQTDKNDELIDTTDASTNDENKTNDPLNSEEKKKSETEKPNNIA